MYLSDSYVVLMIWWFLEDFLVWESLLSRHFWTKPVRAGFQKIHIPVLLFLPFWALYFFHRFDSLIWGQSTLASSYEIVIPFSLSLYVKNLWIYFFFLFKRCRFANSTLKNGVSLSWYGRTVLWLILLPFLAVRFWAERKSVCDCVCLFGFQSQRRI